MWGIQSLERVSNQYCCLCQSSPSPLLERLSLWSQTVRIRVAWSRIKAIFFKQAQVEKIPRCLSSIFSVLIFLGNFAFEPLLGRTSLSAARKTSILLSFRLRPEACPSFISFPPCSRIEADVILSIILRRK